MTETPQKILVTGAAGFLGSHLVDSLIDAGHTVVALDNLSMGSAANLQQQSAQPRFRFVRADVTDSGAFATQDTDFDVVVHLAAFKIPRYGKAIDTLKINYQGTDNALGFAARLGCKCVVASTSDIYGRNPAIPFSETSDSVIGSSTVPRWAYAVSKLFDEHLAFAYQDSYGIPVTVLRFFGSFGPRMHLSWWGGPPPVFINAAFRGDEIPVHGDGQQTRSFTFVSDTVRGIHAATVKREANGEIFNIGSTHEINILDLARLVYRLANPQTPPRIKMVPYESFTGKAYEDVRRRVPDVTKCERVLGVRAEVSLEDGIARTIAWQRNQTWPDAK